MRKGAPLQQIGTRRFVLNAAEIAARTCCYSSEGPVLLENSGSLHIATRLLAWALRRDVLRIKMCELVFDRIYSQTANQLATHLPSRDLAVSQPARLPCVRFQCSGTTIAMDTIVHPHI